VFVAGTGHGLLAGTDTTHPAAIALYVGSVAVVFLLTAIRMAGARQPSPRPARSQRTSVTADS
jgi:hypothetical protein